MKKTTILWLLFSLMGIIALPASAQCTAENNAFSAGRGPFIQIIFQLEIHLGDCRNSQYEH